MFLIAATYPLYGLVYMAMRPSLLKQAAMVRGWSPAARRRLAKPPYRHTHRCRAVPPPPAQSCITQFLATTAALCMGMLVFAFPVLYAQQREWMAGYFGAGYFGGFMTSVLAATESVLPVFALVNKRMEGLQARWRGGARPRGGACGVRCWHSGRRSSQPMPTQFPAPRPRP